MLPVQKSNVRFRLREIVMNISLAAVGDDC